MYEKLRWVPVFVVLACAAILCGRAFADVKRPGPDAIIEHALKNGAPMMIILTGDGGWWGDLDTALGDQFAERGYTVIGLDTNLWFGTERTPAEAATKLSETMQKYASQTKAPTVVLLGWSFGADVIPIIYNRLNPEMKDKISAIALLALGKSTQMQVTLASRTGLFEGDIKLAPELAKLPRPKVVCVYGTQERNETGCLLPALNGVARVELPGSHALRHDAKGIANRLEPFFQKSRAPAPPN